MMFSPNLGYDERSDLQRIMEMKVVDHLGFYLGLSSHISRSKRRDFNFIKERVQKVLNGWKRNLFSVGGKEVLLKVVVQSIPTYSMSCFRFPKSLCSDIMQMMARFWWGSSGSENRIHWLAWNKVCLSKERGGLGFRNIEGFNQALLAKQMWRILVYPGSLVARLFKGKYFPNSDILKAKKWGAQSFVWCSLLWGRDLLRQGLRKRIGDGHLTSVYKDPWLPRESTFRTFTPFNEENVDLKV